MGVNSERQRRKPAAADARTEGELNGCPPLRLAIWVRINVWEATSSSDTRQSARQIRTNRNHF